MFDNRRYARHLCECGLCDEWAKVGRRYINGHSMKGKHQTDVWIAKRVAALRNKKRNRKQKRRMGKAQKVRFERDGPTKGAFAPGHISSKETCRKISESNMGHTVSVETRAKIGGSLMGHLGYNKGGHVSEETKARMRKAMVKRIQQGGDTNGYGKGGWFYSRKNRKRLYYRSHLERDWYMLLERQTRVKSYIVEPVSIPYVWKGNIHLYIPDLLVCYVGGFSDLIELKPEFEWDNPRNQVKWLAAKVWCEKRRKRKQIRRFKVYGYDYLRKKSS